MEKDVDRDNDKKNTILYGQSDIIKLSKSSLCDMKYEITEKTHSENESDSSESLGSSETFEENSESADNKSTSCERKQPEEYSQSSRDSSSSAASNTSTSSNHDPSRSISECITTTVNVRDSEDVGNEQIARKMRKKCPTLTKVLNKEAEVHLLRIQPSVSETTPSCMAIRKSTRNRKRSSVTHATIVCPSCGLTVKSDDLQEHFEGEIDKLGQAPRPRRSCDITKKSLVLTSEDRPEDCLDPHARYKQYLAIRTGRERRRHRAKKALISLDDEETVCPVCNETIIGTEDEIAEHVDHCLQEQEADSEAEFDIDDDYEEYTWAGQTRIRATTMLDGGVVASGFSVSKRSLADEDDSMELDIDGDDSNTYGKAQYTEVDLIPCSTEKVEEDRERKALRNAVLRGGGSRPARSLPEDRQRWEQDTCDGVDEYKIILQDCETDDKRILKDCQINGDLTPTTPSSIVDSLKRKLKEQQVQLDKVETPKCSICMDWYRTPLTSIQCWHVYCEECWLRTLGSKKLCPQCNIITSPTDLRKIYLS